MPFSLPISIPSSFPISIPSSFPISIPSSLPISIPFSKTPLLITFSYTASTGTSIVITSISFLFSPSSDTYCSIAKISGINNFSSSNKSFFLIFSIKLQTSLTLANLNLLLTMNGEKTKNRTSVYDSFKLVITLFFTLKYFTSSS